MSVMKRLARLFTIKTRAEAYLVTYAVAVGAVERGFKYMEIFPGTLGWVFFLLCTGVVFLVGGKLLDSVRPVQPAASVYQPRAWARHRISRTQPRPSRRGAAMSAALRRTD